MRIYETEQNSQEWVEARRGVITGSKAKGIAPPKRGNGTPQGVFELLAEHVAIAKDGEPERDRGHRLENEALLLTGEKYGLTLNLEPGMWLSDDGKLGVSPDAAETGDTPTYAAEAKCLDSKNHLQAILGDWLAKQSKDYNPLKSLKFGTNDFTHQVIQYFVINPKLEIVYFTFYDDRIALDNVMHYVIEVKREHVEEFVVVQELYERDVIAKVNKMIATLKEIK